MSSLPRPGLNPARIERVSEVGTYVLIHGAGSDSWYWHLVVPELRARGHAVVAPDLPCDDDAAGFPEYAEAVVDAMSERADPILVAQSLGGFTAPLVCERVPVRLIVLLAAMVPAPAEPPGDWWANTGFEEARRRQAERDGRSPDHELDVVTEFFHDVPTDVVAEAFARGERDQSGTPFERPYPLERWPDVPTRFLLCRDDRFFPAEFLRGVVRERLDITPDEMDGGHLVALSRPRELAERLDAYGAEVGAAA
jgi:pimeloyl-ACP methyl ester carboxylesterase